MISRVCRLTFAVAAVLFLSSEVNCSAFKKDVVAVADVCRPELLPDVVQIAPYVAAYVSCEIAHADCSATLADIENLGKADAFQCGLAEAHAAIVKLANGKADGGGQ